MTVAPPRLDALPPMAIAPRVERLRAALATHEPALPALLLTSLTNIRYLTGFTGSAAVLIVTADDWLFLSDGRYEEQAHQQITAAGVDCRIEISTYDQKGAAGAFVAAAGVTTMGFEAAHVSVADHTRFASEWFPTVDLVATTDLVEDLRLVKDAGEIARLAAAAAIADAALAEVRPLLHTGITEAAFALELDTAIRRLGASGNSFETIVAAGQNGAKPHARPSDRVIAEGDLLVLDFGAVVDGYCSDMTRTLVLGDPTPTQARMLEVVLAAQAAGVAAVRPGARAKDIDAVCRDHIAAAGWADAFNHSTGHGVGLDIHEAPRVSKLSDTVVEEGFVITVEPGVYLPDHGGVRIEDTVVVTADGCRALNATPKSTSV